jgi:plasmid stabilization system protein ParE
MVQVIWQEKARKKLQKALEFSYTEFGKKTMKRFILELELIEKRLIDFPVSYPPVQQLMDKKRKYRGAIVMDNFLIVYYYSYSSKKVRVVDFWDMRMNPVKLVKGIK